MDDGLSRDLEILLEMFRDGGWQEVRLESGGLSVLLSASAASGSVLLGETAVGTATQVISPIEITSSATVRPASDVIDPAWIPVFTPNLGTFYSSPKPGAPPYVRVGQKVAIGSELFLIEVMKLFTSVRSEVQGIVRNIAVTDAELVEGGQPIMYIEID